MFSRDNTSEIDLFPVPEFASMRHGAREQWNREQKNEASDQIRDRTAWVSIQRKSPGSARLPGLWSLSLSGF